jgi:Histidine phosphatase superfamily (branch 2)
MEPELKQVHVIALHGSQRPLFSKTVVTLEEETSKTTSTSILTAIGQQQHYQLGEWLRERYLESSGDVLLDQYNPLQVHMESSAYEPTMVSANSLALGLFPRKTRGLQLIPDTPAIIPVYTNAGTNDITLRAHDKCPVYDNILEKLYQAENWHVMEFEALPLLSRLSQMPIFEEYVQQQQQQQQLDSTKTYIPLKDIWNIYDAIHVAKMECTGIENMTSPEICNELPAASLAASIAPIDWKDIQELAQDVEWLKLGLDSAGNKLGGVLLNTILKRMEETITTTTTQDGTPTTERLSSSRFYVSVGHHPTLLGLYSALSIPYHLDKVIPEYASALVLELHQQQDNNNSNSEYYVQIFYKSGSSTEATPIMVSHTCRTDQKQGCTLTQFAKEMERNRLTEEQWCAACGNTNADVCLKMQLLQQNSSCSSSDDNSSNQWLVAAVIYFAGMISLVVIHILWKKVFHKRRGHIIESHQGTDNCFNTSQVIDFEEGEEEGNMHAIISTSASLQSKNVGRDSRFDGSVLA